MQPAVGVLEDGSRRLRPGTGQGSVIPPPLRYNIYPYLPFTPAQPLATGEAAGDMIIVRYADAYRVAGFEHEADAHRFLDDAHEA